VIVDYIESLGALFSKKDVRDYKIDCASAPVEFPEEFELKMPKVKNQGRVGSCVAHSIATVIEYFNDLQQNKNEEMSVGYIYGNRTNTTHTKSGMYTRDAVAVTCKYGDVPKVLFPYNEEVPEIIEKFNEQSEELFPKGQPNRFTSYYRLYTDDEIKTSLMENGPVIFAMKWYDDIKVVNGVITTSQKSDGGGHCMVIYGWDKQGWKIQNSWGKFWGLNGRAILPYNIKIREAWGIIDTLTHTETNVIKPYNTKFGTTIAKILNFIINIGYSLIDVLKKR
jgi:C1A family cysteine protease